MDTLTKSIDLSQVSYPVYSIGVTKPLFEGDVVLYVAANASTGDILYRVVDDRSLPGETLAQRRLLLVKQGIKLHKLGKAVFFIGDMIKIAHRSKWFIDSAGMVFQYKKDLSAKLTFHAIKNLFRIPTGGCIVEIYDYPERYKALYYPNSNVTYVGLLHLPFGRVLYGLYEEKPKKSTTRKI